jgi:uncharacterized protein (TIGR03067 family)
MVGFVCLIGAVYCGAENQNSLEGTWRMIAGEADGTSIPKDLFEESRYVIKGTKMVFEVDRKSQAEFMFEADFKAKPMKIDIKDKNDRVALGIFRLEKDRLTLCLSESGGNRPDGFTASQGSGRALITLAREATGEKPKKKP